MDFSKIGPGKVAIGAIVLILLGALLGYNGIVTSREGVNAAWAQVETTYQRRLDLVPNLVETVKGAAKFEQETLMQITEARTKWLTAGSREDHIAAAAGFEGALARLLVTVENYPTLGATKAYQDLLAQLEGTENRISVARRDYNEAVRTYNLRVKRFPSFIIARAFGFGEEKFFEAAAGAESAPTVAF